MPYAALIIQGLHILGNSTIQHAYDILQVRGTGIQYKPTETVNWWDGTVFVP